MADNSDQTTPPEPKPEEEKPADENPKPEVKEETKSEEPAVETPAETPPPAESKPEPPKEPEVKVTEPEKPEVNIEEEVKKQLDEKVAELLKKANEKRKQRREDNLNQIIELARKKEINNQDVRDLLQVSQSTSSSYLAQLVKNGKLKSEKKGKATVYRT